MRLAALHALERGFLNGNIEGDDLQGDVLCGNEDACVEGIHMKGRTKAGETNDRRQRIKQPKPMPHDDEDNVDPDQLPLGIMRKAMDVRNAWVNCHRRACTRGRACRGRQVQCIGELSLRKRRGDPDKRQRDDARSRAILQRILHERMAAREAQTMDMQSSEALPVRARKRPRQAR